MKILPYVITTAAGIGIGRYVTGRTLFEPKGGTRGNNNGSTRYRGIERLQVEDGDLLRFLQENVNDFAVILEDMDGNIAGWNVGAERFFGYSEDEIIGQNDGILFPEEDRIQRANEKEREAALRKGKEMDERWHVRKGGERFYASGVIEPLRDQAGMARGFVKIFRDMTQQRQMQERLQASEAHFRQLVDAMPQIAFTATAEGTVDYFNAKWFEYTGLSVEETYAPNDGWTAALHPEERSHIPRWYELVQSGKPYEAEERFLNRRSGDYRWFLRRALPVRDDMGKVIRWFGTATDIHEQKETEMALVKTKEQLRHYAENLEDIVVQRTGQLNESVESLEGVLYHVAHDLRAPLRAMNGFTEILMRHCAASLGTEGQEYGHRISEAVSRMDHLIQDLMSYGRMARADMPMVELDLEGELRAILSMLESQCNAANAEIEIIPPFPRVLGDSNLLGEILMNLLTNAIKFVAPGVQPRVKVWAESRAEMVRVWVEDNGIGISPEHQERVFRMFERLHDRDTYEGTGIGLAVVAKGTHRMGGRFGIESAPGQGSRFWIELKRV